MLAYLTEKEQQIAISSLATSLQNALNCGRHIYAIFEPTQNEEIAEKFLITGVRYTELLTEFIPEMEDVSPRLVELGQDESFDTWVSEVALFNGWCGIFISNYDLPTLTQHAAYLSYVNVSNETEPTIFRFYNTLVLSDWLQGLNDDKMTYTALGVFSDIFYLKDFPYQLLHHSFDGKTIYTKTLNLLQQPLILPLENTYHPAPCLHTYWELSETQNQSLAQVKRHHFLLQAREKLIKQKPVLKNYSLVAFHQLLTECIDSLTDIGIIDTHFIYSLLDLYFEYRQAWDKLIDDISDILRNNIGDEKEKLAIIANLLYERNEQFNEQVTELSEKA